MGPSEVSMGPYGVFVSLCECLWVPTRSVWDTWDLYASLWGAVGLYGPNVVFVDLYESL